MCLRPLQQHSLQNLGPGIPYDPYILLVRPHIPLIIMNIVKIRKLVVVALHHNLLGINNNDQYPLKGSVLVSEAVVV